MGGVVLKVEDVKAILDLKVISSARILSWSYCFSHGIYFQEYFDKRNEVSSTLNLTKATVTNVEMSGMGDRVCVDLCSIMRPGEGLLVCSQYPFYVCCKNLVVDY